MLYIQVFIKMLRSRLRKCADSVGQLGEHRPSVQRGSPLLGQDSFACPAWSLALGPWTEATGHLAGSEEEEGAVVLSDKPGRTPLTKCRAPCTRLPEPGERTTVLFHRCGDSGSGPQRSSQGPHGQRQGWDWDRGPPGATAQAAGQHPSTPLGQPGSGPGSPRHPRKQDGPGKRPWCCRLAGAQTSEV